MTSLHSRSAGRSELRPIASVLRASIHREITIFVCDHTLVLHCAGSPANAGVALIVPVCSGDVDNLLSGANVCPGRATVSTIAAGTAPDVTGQPMCRLSWIRSVPERLPEKFERIVGGRLYQVNTGKVISYNYKLSFYGCILLIPSKISRLERNLKLLLSL